MDLMPYSALNKDPDDICDYAGFIPMASDFRTPVDPSSQSRYSDEQLYALALYLYSLEPPQNPNRPSALTARGKRVFQAQGCGTCPTAPAYTITSWFPPRDLKFRPSIGPNTTSWILLLAQIRHSRCRRAGEPDTTRFLRCEAFGTVALRAQRLSGDTRRLVQSESARGTTTFLLAGKVMVSRRGP